MQQPVCSSLQTALATVDSLPFSFVIRKREGQSERERREGRERAEYENERGGGWSRVGVDTETQLKGGPVG